MPLESGVYRDLPNWSDSFNDEEVELINQYASSFQNPVKVVKSLDNYYNLFQKIYRGEDERRAIIKKTKNGYYVITHYNNQYLDSYKLDDLSELFNLPNDLGRYSLFV